MKLDELEIDEASPLELLKRKLSPALHMNQYSKASELMYDIIKRKEAETNGSLRHGLGYYAMEIGRQFTNVNYRALMDFFLDKYPEMRDTFRISEETLSELKIVKPDPKDTMGIKRADMPQISRKDYPEFIDYLKDHGATFSKETVNATTLKAIQGEFSDKGVEKQLQKYIDGSAKKPVIASSDNYIIDGHHRWLVAMNIGDAVDIFRVDKPGKELLQLVKDFPKTTYKDIYNESQDDLVDEFLASTKQKYGKRDQCGPACLDFISWARNEKGIELKRVRGEFVADQVVSAKADFTPEMKKEFAQSGLDWNSAADRKAWIEQSEYAEEWKRVPHYWTVDSEGNIHDPSGYQQLVKTGLAKDLDPSRYIPESVNEDIASLADVAAMAAIARVSVPVMKVMLKTAYKTGKGLLQLQRVATAAGVKLADRVTEKENIVRQSDIWKVVNTLADRKDDNPFPVRFYDGGYMKVKPSTAKRIVDMYYRATDSLRDKMMKVIHTYNGFKEIAQAAGAVQESAGVGKITKQNTTPDVKPGETERQAKKFFGGNGKPKPLGTKGATPHQAFNLGLTEDNISHIGTERGRSARKKGLKPGTEEWFKHWFSLPKLKRESVEMMKAELVEHVRLVKENDGKDYMHGYCHQWALNDVAKHPERVLFARIGWHYDDEREEVDHVFTVDPSNGKAYDVRGEFASIEDLLKDYDYNADEVDVQQVDKADIKHWCDVGELKKIDENFKDGKVKGKSRPGRVKAAGASCDGSVTELRRKAKNSSGEKQKMYHWCANMKAGKQKG